MVEQPSGWYYPAGYGRYSGYQYGTLGGYQYGTLGGYNGYPMSTTNYIMPSWALPAAIGAGLFLVVCIGIGIARKKRD